MMTEIKNAQGEQIDYTLHHGAKESTWLAVLGHGVTGNKDRPFIKALAEALATAGVSAVRISFSGNGASGGRFSECTISKEVEDLGAVLEAFPGRRICYIGHSMGAAVGVLRAAQDPRINALVSLAGMVHTKAFAEREFGTVTPGEGFMWDNPNCPLSETYVEDMRRIQSVVPHAPNIRVPWLLVHGKLDDVVPVEESREIFARANEPKQLIELEGADHVFSGDQTQAMIQVVVPWVKQVSK